MTSSANINVKASCGHDCYNNISLSMQTFFMGFDTLRYSLNYSKTVRNRQKA